MEKLVTVGMTAREVFAVAVAPTGSGLLQGALMGHWGAFIFGMTASYVFAAAVGLPALIFARRRGWTGLGQTLLVGSCAGLAAGVLLMALTGTAHFSVLSLLVGASILGAHGFVVSLFYWLIAYVGTPKNDHRNQHPS